MSGCTVHSKRLESRQAFTERLSADLGKTGIATDNWQDCLQGANIQVEASRLSEPQLLFDSAWLRPGGLVIPYGTMSALPLNFVDHIDTFFMDELGQMNAGRMVRYIHMLTREKSIANPLAWRLDKS